MNANRIKKYQEPFEKLAWQHNNESLSDYKSFNKSWLEARKDKVKENAEEMGVKNTYEKQQKLLDKVKQIPKYWYKESQYFPILHKFILSLSALGSKQKHNNHVVHEKTHSQFRTNPWNAPQIQKLYDILKTDLQDANELYPRVQEMRYQFRINPEYEFNKDDIKYFREYVKDKESEDVHHFLNTYDDETILKIFNEVAQNETSQYDFPQNDLFYSKQGNKENSVTKAQPGTKLLTPHKDYLGVPYKSTDYDYFNAHPTNMPIQQGDHWTSRNPVTGQLLKSKNHPTFNLQMQGEKEAGMEVFTDLSEKLYSFPKETQIPLYLKKYNYKIQ